MGLFSHAFKPSRGLVRLWWPDGTTLAGNDFRDVLARLGTLQWEPCDANTMKQRLSDRAWAWTHTAVDPQLPDDEFMRRCQAAKLFHVETNPEKAE